MTNRDKVAFIHAVRAIICVMWIGATGYHT